jgi:hypothetical protein
MIEIYDNAGNKLEEIILPTIANDEIARIEFKIKNTDSRPHIIDYDIQGKEISLWQPPNLLQAGQTLDLIMLLTPLYTIEKHLNCSMKIRVR